MFSNCGGYRTAAEQTEIYESSLRDNSPQYTAAYVAWPGCSEHQTGLAVDVGLSRWSGDKPDFIAPDFPDGGVCLAFKRLASRYGFVQRYRAGMEDITGIACEPWHSATSGIRTPSSWSGRICASSNT
ncbi:D-alanyl-D-alanine carboxypeptidase family protein [Cohnella sp. 56]|uniref:D-alanyl-D-alanine carboxypeptidase family protein n=1 Tax=Cohnella sp. 56 TaxID=3113722 RepID=UPI0040403977